jgi:hypothetical protein
MVKKFIHGTALLGVLLFFGCETGTDSVTLEGEPRLIGYDKGVKTEVALSDALKKDNGINLIAIVDDITLTDDLTIPEGKTVHLLAGNITTEAKTLTVEGSLDVKNGYALTITESGGSLVVEDGGTVIVQKGGILGLAGADAANDGDTPSAETVLGSSGKVTVSGGELRIKTVTATNLESVFGSVQSGLLRVTDSVAIKPSDASDIGITETRKLKITVSGNEDADTLTIPVGLDMTATGSLESLTGNIAVDGEFTATTITVNGEYTLNVGGNFAVTGMLTIALDAEYTGNGVISTGGNGKIKFVDWSEEDEDEVETEYTAPGGVNVADIPAAKAALEASVKTLTDNPLFNLKDTFNSSGGPDDPGIGSVEITAKDVATPVQDTADGSDQEPITLVKGTLLYSGSVAGTSVSGTDSSNLSTASNFTLSLSSGKLAVTDSGYADSSAKLGIVTFSKVQLINRGLVSSEVANFKIGVKTSRS